MVTIKNSLLLGGDLSDYAPANGAVDSLGIRYDGPILGGMVTTRAFYVEWETEAGPSAPAREPAQAGRSGPLS